MTEFWFDSNFFIVANETRKVPILRKLFIQLRTKHSFNITNRIRNEVFFFNELLRLVFKVTNIELSQEFSSFCTKVKFCLKNSKNLDEPADQSLAYAAGLSDNQCYIVTNDEGFKRAKKNLSRFMEKVEIIEPMEFIQRIISEINDRKFQNELEDLILIYANHFIKHRLKDPTNPRPIEDILQNLLYYTTISATKVVISTLPEDLYSVLRKVMANQVLNPQEEQKIELVKKYFLPFALLNASESEDERNLRTNLLYVEIPELLVDLKQLNEENSEEIFKFSLGMEELIERELVRIRIEETIHYLQDCNFDEAYLHFIPLIESNWCFSLDTRTKEDLKLLYGIFQLHFGKFNYLSELLKTNLWGEYSGIKQIFELLLDIKDGSDSMKIESSLDEEITMIYNLGLFFSNSGNSFGLQLFNALIELSNERIKTFNWYQEFLKRYILELKVSRQEINPLLREKLLYFIPKKELEDNTSMNFDRQFELKNFTSINLTPILYKQPFFYIRSVDFNEFWKVYCWNDSIRSIIILLIPKILRSNFKNIRTISIIEGKIRTKKPILKEKKNARIIIEIDDSSILDFKIFQLKIFENV